MNETPQPLTQAFAEARGDAELPAGLERTLHGLWEAGAKEWPGVSLDAQIFARGLGEKCRQGVELASLHASDLYLVFACNERAPGALDALERVLARARPSLQRLDPSADFADDATQQLREKLLGVGGTARLVEYAGTGPLLSWLRAALVRTGLNLQRRGGREVAVERDLLEQVAPALPGPELDVFRERYRDALKEAFQSALAELSDRTRNVLRLHLGQGMTLEQVGRSYGVNRSTVSRWVQTASAHLIEATRVRLSRQLKLSRSELDSIMRLFSTRLDVSLGAWLESKG